MTKFQINEFKSEVTYNETSDTNNSVVNIEVKQKNSKICIYLIMICD